MQSVHDIADLTGHIFLLSTAKVPLFNAVVWGGGRKAHK